MHIADPCGVVALCSMAGRRQVPADCFTSNPDGRQLCLPEESTGTVRDLSGFAVNQDFELFTVHGLPCVAHLAPCRQVQPTVVQRLDKCIEELYECAELSEPFVVPQLRLSRCSGPRQ